MASRVLSCAAATMAVISPPKLSGCDYSRTSYPSLLSSSSVAAAKVTVRIGSVKCKALGESSSDWTVYQGIYSPWTVDPSDVREVRTCFVLFLTFSVFICMCMSLYGRACFSIDAVNHFVGHLI
jgi:hypothetical protein